MHRHASGDFVGAYELTAHDPHCGWSPDLIREVIAGYGLPEPAPDGIASRPSKLPWRVSAPGPR